MNRKKMFKKQTFSPLSSPKIAEESVKVPAEIPPQYLAEESVKVPAEIPPQYLAEESKDLPSFDETDAKIKETFRLINELHEIEKQSLIDKSHRFYKKKIVFTGTLQAASRAEAKTMIYQVGGTVGTTISRNIHYLVCGYQDEYKHKGYETSAKYDLAVALNELGANIQIIDEDEFWRILGL